MVFSIAIPMTLAYITTPLLGLVDTGVVGQLGDAALIGGLAVGAVLFDTIFTMFNFLRAATTGLVAQAMGAGDEEQQRIIAIRALIISVLGGALVLALAPLILQISLSLMTLTPAVVAAVTSYFMIRVLAAPLTLLNYSVLGWLLGQSRAGMGLLLQTVLNGTNIALSFILGISFGWGLEGVAWATVIAEGVATVLGLLLFFARARLGGAVDWRRVFNRPALMRLFAVNRDIMIRSFVLVFTFAYFTAQGALFGETTLAANAILMNFFLVAGYLLDGFAMAAEQFVGRAIGANYRPAFDKSVRLTLYWGLLLGTAGTVIAYAVGPWLIDLLTVLPDVRSEARVYLLWAALTPIVGVLAFQMDGIYIGATWSATMRNMMLLSIAAFMIVWYLTQSTLGNHGLWLALLTFLGVRGITLSAALPAHRRRAFLI
ncbi:MATE family efflux transporter [Pseudahrensia aquimaris]|uniref:MATE family efflux transporter n=1 Tax=Pseudahrensia aquimaris TaxID=744461 RepID=A0ABW3FK54_9HYPH